MKLNIEYKYILTSRQHAVGWFIVSLLLSYFDRWGYRGGSPTAVQAWQPCPLWEPSPSHPILLQTRGFAVFCVYCVLIVFFSVNCVFCVFLQYFDTVGWVFWPVKTVARITYTVLVETLNPAQSINWPLMTLTFDIYMYFTEIYSLFSVFWVPSAVFCLL